jgi:hypothetical protein
VVYARIADRPAAAEIQREIRQAKERRDLQQTPTIRPDRLTATRDASTTLDVPRLCGTFG